jgi:hypothetical protein
MARAVSAVGILKKMDHGDQSAVKEKIMKTRDEMIYDFMLALSANGGVYKDWEENIEDFGDFSENIQMFAKELADKYLKELA